MLGSPNQNLLSKSDSQGTTTFGWNEENQLTQVSLPGGLTINYRYDGLGRRIHRTTTAGASERYVYDGRDVLLDLNADWSVATTYLNDLGIDSHLRQTNSFSGVSYFLTNHLGSTAGLTDPNGNLVEQIAYDSFGNATGSTRTRYSFTGRERDPDTGQLYYRARFYDPQLGRFTSEDPIGFAGRDVNFYSYVKNHPLFFRDPSDLQRCDPIIGAILGVGAGGVVGFIGGGLLGPPVGGFIGAAMLGSVGTFVEPGGGTIVGGGGGAAAGAAAGAVAGPIIGGAIGAGIGGYIGYRIWCRDDCDDPPDNVIPFPTPQPLPLPPPGGSGRDGQCFQAYVACLLSNFDDKDHVERCRQAYLNCKKGLPTIFPGGDWLP